MKSDKLLMTGTQWNRVYVVLLLFISLSGFTLVPTSGAEEQGLYAENGAVSYSVEFVINLKERLFEWEDHIEIWTSRIKDQGQYQNSTPGAIDILGNNYTKSYDPTDIYGNSYDYYNINLTFKDDQFSLLYRYTVDLASHTWEVPESLTIDDYDQGSNLYINNTQEEPGCETSDVNIQTTINQIIGSETGILNIAQSIFLYLARNMNYLQMSKAQRAEEAILSLEGDCSEYSTLMVCLLRAAGIPARKVVGFVFQDEGPMYDVYPGDKKNYNERLPAHAWVQYYVPGLGWVTADPTFGYSMYNSLIDEGVMGAERAALQYFNRVDYIHLISTIGGYFGFEGDGIEPPLLLMGNQTELYEFSTIETYIDLYSSGSIFYSGVDSDLYMDIEILETTNLQPPPSGFAVWFGKNAIRNFLIILGIIGIIIICLKVM